jgi:hypothetical protein
MICDVEKDEYGDLFTIKEFVDAVVCGAFIPDDGIGFFGTESHYTYDRSVWGGVGVVSAINEGATHVHWFNK